jgi:hypothetical protein
MVENVLGLIDGRVSVVPYEEQLNFSIKKIDTETVVEIPLHQQMFVNGTIVVDGQLNLFGEVIYLDLEDEDDQIIPEPIVYPENFSHFRVLTSETKTIPAWQQMNIYGELQVFGELQNFGNINIAQLHQEQPDPEEFIHEENFSYKKIVSSNQVKIRSNEQMIVCGDLEIQGQLNLHGELALISSAIDENNEDDYLPPFKINAGEVYKISNNRIMFLPRSLINFGLINLQGELALGSL